jgi:hypothetical protein
MRVSSVSALLVVTAICLIIAVAAEVFIDDYVRPSSLFGYILVSTLLTSFAAMAVIDIDIPN